MTAGGLLVFAPAAPLDWRGSPLIPAESPDAHAFADRVTACGGTATVQFLARVPSDREIRYARIRLERRSADATRALVGSTSAGVAPSDGRHTGGGYGCRRP
jgi:hypothetical protein